MYIYLSLYHIPTLFSSKRESCNAHSQSLFAVQSVMYGQCWFTDGSWGCVVVYIDGGPVEGSVALRVSFVETSGVIVCPLCWVRAL